MDNINMPKLKTKSSLKGRYKITGTGKILFHHVGKRHGMTKRSKQQIRDKRKPEVMSYGSSKTVFKKFLSYFKKLRKRL
jgi:large subunit ribosomal protein L35